MKCKSQKRVIIHTRLKAQAYAYPNVCLTPSPAGPVPVPYPSFAYAKDIKRPSQRVLIDSGRIALARSTIHPSFGDEAGTLGGVLSKTTGGKVVFLTYDPSCRVEGEGVVRHGDITLHNLGPHGGISNTPPGVITEESL